MREKEGTGQDYHIYKNCLNCWIGCRFWIFLGSAESPKSVSKQGRWLKVDRKRKQGPRRSRNWVFSRFKGMDLSPSTLFSFVGWIRPSDAISQPSPTARWSFRRFPLSQKSEKKLREALRTWVVNESFAVPCSEWMETQWLNALRVWYMSILEQKVGLTRSQRQRSLFSQCPLTHPHGTPVEYESSKGSKRLKPRDL